MSDICKYRIVCSKPLSLRVGKKDNSTTTLQQKNYYDTKYTYILYPRIIYFLYNLETKWAHRMFKYYNISFQWPTWYYFYCHQGTYIGWEV